MAEAYINLGGKPKKFQDLQALDDAIQDYFVDCDNRGAPYTITGLAYTLETSRATLLNIQKNDYYSNDFKKLVSLAKQKILQRTEEGMLSSRYNAAGSIFTLKNNFGYVDKIEQVVEVKNSVADSLEDRRKRVIQAATAKIVELPKRSNNEDN